MAAFFKVGNRAIEWHVGEKLPAFVEEHRVVTIQADGDELEVILRALRATE